MDLLLQAGHGQAEPLEDDNGGGGTTPFLVLDVEAGQEVRLTVAAAAPASTGKALLHVFLAPETSATRAAVEGGRLGRIAADDLAKEGDLDGARARMAAGVAAVLVAPGAGDSAEVAAWLWSIAYRTYERGDLDTATRALRAVLEFRERMLPGEHPDLAGAQGDVAVMLKVGGDLPAARVLEEKVLAARSRALPDDHPALQASRGNLALTLAQSASLDWARGLAEKVFAVRIRRPSR